ncbi:MAG: hypothetical protein HPPSJP_4030 [Candidatus Hepatoplasma scabrum]|nr:MAG: hypothetical protein HPPSJP_4030 [Candidatus Hepatoplasma sp.]
MEILAILLLLIFILFLIISFWFFLLLERQNRKRILNIYYHDLYKYQIRYLYKIFLQFKKENNFFEQEIFNDLEDTIKNLNYVTFNKLKILYQKLDQENKIKFYFGKKKFQNKLKELDQLQFDYKITYAKTKFKINEFNLINEIKTNLISKINQIFVNFLQEIKNSIYQKNLLKGKYLEKINKVDLNIKKLSTAKIDLDDFIKKITLINKEIVNLKQNFVFYLDINKSINIEYKVLFKNIKKLLKDQKIPFFYLKIFEKKFQEIKYDFTKLKIYLSNLNFNKVKKLNDKLFFNLNLLSFKMREIINKSEFIDKMTKNLLFFISKIKDYQKIIRYNYSLFIKDDNLKIKESLSLEKLIVDNFKQDILNKEIVNQNIFAKKLQKLFLISEYLQKYQKIILDKSELQKLQKKEDDLLKLNFIFYKIESLFFKLPNKYQQKYQEKFKQINDFFALLLNQIKNLKNKRWKDKYFKFKEEITIFYQQIFKDLFLISYLNEIILIVNKYRFDKKITSLKNKVEYFYQKDNLIEALRIAHETVITYHISR